MLFYAQGASVIEAYWKSVWWPQQGLFVGEPLAAPFARTGLGPSLGAGSAQSRASTPKVTNARPSPG